jgi:hypothetical protein
MTGTLIGQIPTGTIIDDGHGNPVEIIRFHRGATKGKVCFEIRSGSGIAMGEVADTTRFEIITPTTDN